MDQAALVEEVHSAQDLVQDADALCVLGPACQLGGAPQPLLPIQTTLSAGLR